MMRSRTSTALLFLGLVPLLLLGCGDDASVSPDGGGCVVDDDCDDGVFCNGSEVCAAGACAAGEAPCEGLCEETMDQCIEGCAEPDADGDGVASIACGGADCDDSDPARFPGAIEVCDAEGVDEDCDPTTVGDVDVDGDGHIDAACCNGSTCGDDCADRIADVFGGAMETCDLRDQDCDGDVDEGVSEMRFVDTDGDLHGDDETIIACPGAAKTSPTDIDCDNASAPRHGDQREVCDGIDNDCDEIVDEQTSDYTWYPDVDGDGFGDPAGDAVVACAPPADHSLLPLDCNDGDAAESPAAPELCNGRDDDCDGVPSFEIRRGDTEDDDRDGYGDSACGGTDCDDRDPFSNPGTAELCDGRDNDCDGTVDESVTGQIWYLDADGDGHGDPADGIESCERQSDRVLVGDDCADDDPARHPGRLELCNGVDDDCDGSTDEGQLGGLVAYRDDDGDGFGVTSAPMFACSDALPSGYAAAPGDCDDADAAVLPTAVDVCDGVDNDCDGALDEGEAGSPPDWYEDLDGDGFGSGAIVATQCEVVAGAVPQGGDCDEGDASRFPGATESCDGVDEDCDGTVDEGATMVVHYADGDGDGYADDGAAPSMGCSVPEGSTTDRGDCDDTDAALAPGATELCDGVDQDCDGALDEGLPSVTLYLDEDEDGYAAGSAGATTGCGPVTGLTDQGGDCDDTDPARSPGATDVCNGIDDDCNGTVDDGGDNFCAGQPETTGICDPGGVLRQCQCSSSQFADCDLSQINGCETDIESSNENCGYCNMRCLADQACQGGSCQPAFLEDVEAGFTSTCAVREFDRILCWGDMDVLFFETGSAGNILTPRAPDNLPDVANILQLAARRFSSDYDNYCVIGVLESGERDIFCWGGNRYGQVGDGTTLNGIVTTPTRIAASVDDVVDDWEEVAVSGDFVLARRATGEVYSWGRNGQGQLGRGFASNNEPIPALVTGLTDAAEIAVGGSHACARTTGGEVRCWGSDSVGQLGNPVNITGAGQLRDVLTSPEMPYPRLVGVEQIALGTSGSCARRTDQTVWCWGNLSSDGSYPATRTYATQTSGLSSASDIDCGHSSCCAVAANDVWCWGASGSFGQYGDGTTDTGRRLPTQVLTDSGVLGNMEQIRAGYGHMCAFNMDEMVCWGNGGSGQLGRGTLGNEITAGAPDFVYFSF